MSNILLNQNRWSDNVGNIPPRWWNGSLYFVNDSARFGVGLVQTAAAVAGDTVAFTLNNLVAITGGTSNSLTIKVNNVVLTTISLQVLSSTVYTTPILNDGDVITINCVNITSGVPYILYGVDFTITPTPNPVYITPTPTEVVLSWSDDGGHVFANEQIQYPGAIGSTAQRVIFRRIGSTRRNSGLDRVFELSSADPVQVCLIGASFVDN